MLPPVAWLNLQRGLIANCTLLKMTRSQEREETDIWVCVCLGENACLCLYAYVFVHVYLFAYALCLQMSDRNGFLWRLMQIECAGTCRIYCINWIRMITMLCRVVPQQCFCTFKHISIHVVFFSYLIINTWRVKANRRKFVLMTV